MLDFGKLLVSDKNISLKDNFVDDIEFSLVEKNKLREIFFSKTFENLLIRDGISVEFDIEMTTSENLFEYDILGIDGSQIYPSRHDGHPQIGLINIGVCCFEFRSQMSNYWQESYPEVITILNEPSYLFFDTAMFDLLRQVKELERSLFLAEKFTESFILLDAALFFRNLRNKNLDLINSLLKKYVDLLIQIVKTNATIFSYTSLPASNKIVSLIKFLVCDEKYYFRKKICKGLCGNILCAKLCLKNDSQFLFLILEEGETTPLFGEKIIDDLSSELSAELINYFYFYRTVNEIVMIETFKKNKLTNVHRVVIDQIEKGWGYPLVLSQCHRVAAINEIEKQEFFRHIGLFTEKSSQKHVSKRLAFF